MAIESIVTVVEVVGGFYVFVGGLLLTIKKM